MPWQPVKWGLVESQLGSGQAKFQQTNPRNCAGSVLATMADFLEKEKNDPAMVAYLKALGIDPDYVAPKDDPRRVVISKLEVVFKDHANAVLALATVSPSTLFHFQRQHISALLHTNAHTQESDVKKAKETPLVIKEGAEYKIRVHFRVQHQLVAGLKIVSSVSKMGKKLQSDTDMLGSYPPKTDFTSLDIGGGDFVEAPTGMLARGEYKAHMKVDFVTIVYVFCLFGVFSYCLISSSLMTITNVILTWNTRSRFPRIGKRSEPLECVCMHACFLCVWNFEKQLNVQSIKFLFV